MKVLSRLEKEYCELIRKVLVSGDIRSGRNGKTIATFGHTLKMEGDTPLLIGRKIHTNGICGEFAAMIRGPESLHDFERWGCNYWKQWAKPDGSIDLDYGNQWIDFNGVNQIEKVVESLQTQPHGRRHVISAWRPDHLDTTDLPCCHFLYQWYVADGKLHMIWYQRSADIMIGLPSDFVLAYLFNCCMAVETKLVPGDITFMLGDCHIYDEHLEGAASYLRGIEEATRFWYPSVGVRVSERPLTGSDLEKFEPADFFWESYDPLNNLKFELKS